MVTDGYLGKILRVDLSKMETSIDELDAWELLFPDGMCPEDRQTTPGNPEETRPGGVNQVNKGKQKKG